MQRSLIVIDPQVSVVSKSDVTRRRPELDVREPEDVVSSLDCISSPVSFVTSSSSWGDEFLDGLSAGDWVASVGSGYESIPLESFREDDILFTNSPGVNAQQIGEHVFATTFSFSRHLWTFREQQQSNTWDRGVETITDFAGDVCAIVGLGHVGEAVARRARAFDMTVRGVKRRTEDYEGAADEVYSPESLLEALDGARLVVLAVRLTDETRHMIGSAELKAVSNDAILVNVARGPVLDADAAVDALDAGELRAACLDVFNPEPLPPESPLWDREDVLITPHAAGLSDKYTDRFLNKYLPQYDRWCSGAELENRVV